MSITTSARYKEKNKKKLTTTTVNPNANKFFTKVKKRLDKYTDKVVYSSMNRESRNKNMNRIVEKIIPENINGYGYFVYLWEVVETGTKYCGYHKGIPLKDGYYHSSEGKTFKKEFSDYNLTLKYKVLGYYKYEDEAKRYEGLQIRSRKNKGEKMANISNSRKPFWDKDKVYEMYNKIQSGVMGFELNPKSEIESFGWYQSREEGSESHKRQIKRRINDAGGSIEKTDALVIARGTDSVLGLGDEVGISGKHTGGAISQKTCKATEYKRLDVDLTGWSSVEITKLSSLCNDDDTEKLKQTKRDYVKELVSLWEDEGIEPDSTEAYDWLEGYKTLTITDRTSVMEQAKVKVDTKKDELAVGKEKKEYHHMDKETIEIMNSYKEDNNLVLLLGSGAHSYNRIFETIWDAKIQDWEKGIHTIIIVVHHTSLQNKKDWKKSVQPKLIAIEEKLGLPFEIDYTELPYYKSDKKRGK
tara:strand:- start:48 stop:1460 length:1413 start_codon:yes stop_codon:yes gene_type:complete